MTDPARKYDRNLIEHVPPKRRRELVRTTRQRRGQRPVMARVPSFGPGTYWYWEG